MARNSLLNIMNLLDEAKNGVSVEQSFLNDLKRSIETSVSKNAVKPSQTYKPSGMNCIRASYYQVSGIAPDEIEPSYILEGICNSGSDIHVRIQTAVMQMQENGIDCEWVDVEQFVTSRNLKDLEVKSHTSTETKLYNKKYNISFMCDGIIRYKGKYYILELKTEASRKWYNREGVAEGHYHQATAYSLSFGLDEVIFVYINRDNLDMKSFLFTVTDDMRKEIVDYIKKCDGYIKRKIAPPKPEEAGGKFCQYCTYRLQCRKDA